MSKSVLFCGSFVLFLSCFVLLCFRARLFIDALWSPAGGAGADLLALVCDV